MSDEEMPEEERPRYGPTYRIHELSLILKHAIHGDSLGLVGIAGTGKSNIVNVLRDDMPYKHRILGDEAGRLIVADVNGIQWDTTQTGLWQLMSLALSAAMDNASLNLPENKIRRLVSKEEHELDRLRYAINWICQATDRIILFVLDDFDNVIRTGPSPC